MREPSRVDAFHVAVGCSAIVVGAVRLFVRDGAGWSLLLVGVGAVLLVIEWGIANRVEFEIAGAPHIAALIVGGTGVWLSALYLSRGADDLPHFVPGRDGDSSHVRLIPGIVALTIGVIAVSRAIAIARPRRGTR
jgi:hypothetical protein